MLLLTDYHELGSLHDFLKENTVEEEELVSTDFIYIDTKIVKNRQ